VAIKVKVGGSRSIRSVPKQDTLRPIIAQGEKKPIIVPDSVVLGIDTIGPYTREIFAGDGITVQTLGGDGGESANVTITHVNTSDQANTANSPLGFVKNISLDQFGHLTDLTNTELNPTNFSAANNIISSNDITFGNTAITLGGTTDQFLGLNLIQVGDLTITGSGISGSGNITLTPPVDNVIDMTNHRIVNVRDPIDPYDVVTNNYLGDTLEALELSLLIISDPVKPTDATNKRYVDNVAQGISVRPSSLAATTEDLGVTFPGAVFEAGNSAIDTTITLPEAFTIEIDGVSNWTVGSQLLVKDQANPVENGSYDLVQVGDPTANLEWIFARSDFNNESVEIPGTFEFVTDGIVNKNKGFVATVADAETFEIDVHSISWVQFQGVGTFTAGEGLTLTGTEFSVNEQQILDTITTPDNVLTVVGNGGLVIPVGTQAERTQPAAGMVRFNTDQTRFEGYNGIAWAGLGGTIDTDQDTFVQAETTPNADNDELKFFVGGTQQLIINTNGSIEANSSITINDNIQLGHSEVAEFNLTGAIQFPKGTTLERPSPQTGMIRYNTDDQRFEGFDNTGSWSSIAGSVIDLDRDTKIVAESSSGADNDQIQFFTAGTERLQLSEVGLFKFGDGLNKFTIDYLTGDTQISGNLGVTGNVTIGGNIQIGDADTDAITVSADFESNLVPDVTDTYTLGSATKDWLAAYVAEIRNATDFIKLTADVVKVNSTGGFIIPVGNVSERPTAEQGMIRYNTQDARFEAYNGTAWTGLGGVIDVDQNTFIRAESSPGADNNQLDFFANNQIAMQIDSDGSFKFGDGLSKVIIDYNTGLFSVNGKMVVDDVILDNNSITSANGDLVLGANTASDQIDASGHIITNVGTPVANTDAVPLGYLAGAFTSQLTVIDEANTFNSVNLIQNPTLTLGNGLIAFDEDAGNNAISIGIQDTGVTPGSYGNDGFTPRIVLNDQGQVTFATEIPVELQANAIPDFTETVHDLIGEMFRNNTEDGVSITYDDPTDKLNVELTANYVGSVTAGFGITVTGTPAPGYAQNVALNVGTIDARYINVTGDTMTGNLDAPRFRDSADVRFYGDFASESRLNSIRVGYLQNAAQIKMEGSTGTSTLYSDGTKLGQLNNAFNYVFYGRKDTSDFYVENGDVIAERFVDTESTSYFLHPGGTDSNLKQVNIETQLDVADLTFNNNTIDSSTNTIDFSSNRLLNLLDPTNDQDAATKVYVDSVAQGLRVIPSALAATTADLGATYNNTDGTLTNNGTLAAFELDDVTEWSVGDRVLVKDQTDEIENGSYEVTTVGDGTTAWVLTRGEYFNETSEIPGAFQFVTDGTQNKNTGYVATVADAEGFVLGVGDVIWYQFSGAGTYSGGEGLTLTGTDFSVNVDDTGIEIVADTLQLKDGGVTNAKMANPTFTVSDETDANTAITLGETLQFNGVDGVDTTVTAGTVSIAVNEIDGGSF
jgi:hypothetical protein